jgi:hypothetical protein
MRVRLALFVVLLAAWPSAARAQGWWDVLEEFSGPGPFNTGTNPVTSFSLRPMCVVSTPPAAAGERSGRTPVGWFAKGPQGDYPCQAKNDSVIGFLELRIAHARSEDKRLFPDETRVPTGRTGVNLAQALFMRQLNTALSIGAGVGAMWFSGVTVDKAVPSMALTPIAVELTPFRVFGSNHRWARLVVFHFEEIAVLGGLHATDFNALSNSGFSSNAELKRSFSVDLDVMTLFRK